MLINTSFNGNCPIGTWFRYGADHLVIVWKFVDWDAAFGIWRSGGIDILTPYWSYWFDGTLAGVMDCSQQP